MNVLSFTAFIILSFNFLIAGELKLNDLAPEFSLQKQDGSTFSLSSRKKSGRFTILYFYPKAGTPGCTKQACGFRDNLEKIKLSGADVFGISTDSVDDQLKFYKEHKLNFDLLADHDGKVTDQFGAKMLVGNFAKRWTFILNDNLEIKDILKDVDPIQDSIRVKKVIENLKSKK